MNIKQIVLQHLHSSLFNSGLAKLYARLIDSQSAVILMYHSISSETDREWIDPHNDIPVDVFEKQMRYLHRNCKVVSMDDLCSDLQNNIPIKPKTVVISFDDGYLNNFQAAAKVLNKYNLPAIIYLATGYIDRGDAQWIDELYSLFKFRSSDNLELKELGCISLKSAIDESSAYERIRTYLLSAAVGDRRILLDRIGDQLCPDKTPPRLTLDWQEISDLISRNSKFTVGIHTRDHIDLTSVSEQMVKKEIHTSFSDVQRQPGY